MTQNYALEPEIINSFPALHQKNKHQKTENKKKELEKGEKKLTRVYLI